MRLLASLALALACLPFPLAARGLHGRLQLQDIYATEDSTSLAAQMGVPRRNDRSGDLRLAWSPHLGDWSFATAYVIGFDWGDAPSYKPLSLLASTPPLTWWNLSDQFIAQKHLVATQRIDRLSIAYTSTHVVLKLGRQALTWGAGIVFHPMDLFDPFAPDAIDTEYKPGTDMLYGQYLFDDGSDLQAVIVPRPGREGGGLTTNASSFAMHYHASIGAYQTTLLVARDHGDVVAGLGVNGTFGGASWNAEVIPTFVQNAGTYTSLLFNLSDAGSLWTHDVTGFVEYFRNGFGVSSRYYLLSQLPVPLVNRLQRGQVFTTGRDYLALGAQLQVTALLQVSPTLIANLDDRSLYGLAEATYSLSDNLNLVIGAQLPVGPARTEFGGLPVLQPTAPYLEQPARLYIALRRYF